MSITRLIGLTLAIGVSLCADTIEFTHTGTGSGTIGTTSFTNAAFTITDIGNTASRQSYSAGFFIDDTMATIAIAGLGTFDFVTPTRTFVNNVSSEVGFSRAGSLGADLYDGPSNGAFATYDLLSSIGPIGGSGFLLQWTLSPVLTNDGQLIFSNSTSDATFRAQVVPEPSSVILLVTIVGGLLGTRRFRIKRS